MIVVLILLITVQVHGLIIFERQAVEFNKDYGYGDIKIEELPTGGNAISAWGNITKLIDGKITLKLNFLEAKGSKNRVIMVVQKINYCDLMRGQGRYMMMLHLLEQLRTFGDLVGPCPVKSGYYTLNNFTVDDTKLPGHHMIQTNKSYGINFIVRDENQGKSISLVNLRVFFKRF